MEGSSITGSVDLSSEIRTRVIPSPSDHSPEYDENTTGPCKKMPAPAPPSGARARLASPPCGTSGPEERRRGSELGTTGNAKARELAQCARPGRASSVRPMCQHRPSRVTRSTQLRQDGGGIPVASPAPALGGP